MRSNTNLQATNDEDSDNLALNLTVHSLVANNSSPSPSLKSTNVSSKSVPSRSKPATIKHESSEVCEMGHFPKPTFKVVFF
jgi:hypothetical protein